MCHCDIIAVIHALLRYLYGNCVAMVTHWSVIHVATCCRELIVIDGTLYLGLFVSVCCCTGMFLTRYEKFCSLSLGSRPAQAQEQPPTVCLFSLFGCYLQETSSHISFTWPLPLRHQHAWWPIDVMELFLWFGCSATEPGFVWDIGTMEIWLIDWSCFLCEIFYCGSKVNEICVTIACVWEQSQYENCWALCIINCLIDI